MSARGTHRLLSAANTINATLIKSSPGKVYTISGFNAGVITYLKLYDKATAPAETDTPRRTIYLPVNANFHFDFADGQQFIFGIGYRMTTVAADNDTTAVASGAILALNIDYS